MKLLADSLEFAPDKIILFGSHAWGIPNSDSDIDLFVIVRRSNFTPIKRAKKVYQCLQGLRTPTEVIVSTWEEKTDKSPFIHP